MKKTVIFLIILIFIFVFLGGFLYYFYSSQKKTSQPIEIPQTETQKKNTITLPKTFYNLVGTVKNYDKNSITFEASIPQLNEEGEVVRKTEIRKALLLPTTKFSKLTFVVQPETGKKIPKEEKISLTDIKIGDQIEVISNQDISSKKEFEVLQVRVLPK
jgi:flagellar basal body-associated protein FliL